MTDLAPAIKTASQQRAMHFLHNEVNYEAPPNSANELHHKYPDENRWSHDEVTFIISLIVLPVRGLLLLAS